MTATETTTERLGAPEIVTTIPGEPTGHRPPARAYSPPRGSGEAVPPMLSTWGRAVAAALALLAMALGGYEIVDADAPAPVVSDTVEIRTAVPN